MSTRVQVILSGEERARFAEQARREGKSLSAWLGEAGRSYLEGRTPKGPEALDAIFARCDDRVAEEGATGIAGAGREPEWNEHLSVLRSSRKRSDAGT